MERDGGLKAKPAGRTFCGLVLATVSPEKMQPPGGVGAVKIVITGGAGFIGSALCRFLVGYAKCSVLNIDKLTYAANLRSLDSIATSPLYAFLKADICDFEVLRHALEQFQPDAIIHLAAESHVDRSITGAADFVHTNTVGLTLCSRPREVIGRACQTSQEEFRLLHVSTDEVYGSLNQFDHFREDTPYNPSSPYSASKAASDHFVIAWHRTYGLPVLICNCSNNYGPYQFPEKLISLAILNAIESKPLPVYGDGLNVRDWLYVEDHVRALYLVLQRGRLGEKYNIGGRNERDNLGLISQLCGIIDEFLRPAVLMSA